MMGMLLFTYAFQNQRPVGPGSGMMHSNSKPIYCFHTFYYEKQLLNKASLKSLNRAIVEMSVVFQAVMVVSD